MAINIKKKPDPAEEASAHEAAAAEIGAETGPETTTDITKTLTKKGEVLEQSGHTETEYQNPGMGPGLYERMEVGMAFKMPVADYTMLEFSIRRSVPYAVPENDPDTVFEDTRKWVEANLNKMIEEQQTETD